MTIENEAFIDLEQMLHLQTDLLWRAKWRELEKEMNRLANAGDWEGATKIANNIDLQDIADDLQMVCRVNRRETNPIG